MGLGPSLSSADATEAIEDELLECLTLPVYGIPECVDALKPRCGGPACVSAIDSRVAARVEAERVCVAESRTSACSSLPDKGVRRKCVQDCHLARDRQLRNEAERSQAVCERRFVEAKGRGKFACSISGADRSIGKAELAAEFKLAMHGKDESALDAVLQRSEHAFAAELEAQCSKACRKRGPTLLRAAADQARAASLLEAYDLCMVKADASEEARQLDAREGGRYCAFIERADGRCRRAQRCEWIEAHSALRCHYVNAAIALCKRE
jgi:hypothetical protein